MCWCQVLLVFTQAHFARMRSEDEKPGVVGASRLSRPTAPIGRESLPYKRHLTPQGGCGAHLELG